MSYWNGSIIGPNGTAHEGRIYSLSIYCGEDYPNVAPEVRFISRVNMDCVNQDNGSIIKSKFNTLKNWNSEYTIETILIELRNQMSSSAHKHLAQPPEFSE